MTVILVRHAESEGNVGGMIQGWTDLRLTEAGEAQAQMVARRFAGADVAAIYTSPLLRARSTAAPIAEVLGLELVEMPDLRERNYGQAQGLTWAEAAARWPLGEAAHHRDWAMAVPEVESLAGLRRRSVAVVNALLDRHEGETALVVSHGGTLVQIIAHLFGLPEDVWPRIRMSNTSVTVVGGSASQPRVSMLNDICHLDDRARASTLAL
ncbi:MAG: histidine phosphatase family protein [Dehalococcoidia bacterium]|nr:histidine phosphatase family protein [Dehalococcoidia bacterium]